MTKRISIFDEISNDAGSRARAYQWYMDKIKEMQSRGLVNKNKLISNYSNMVTSNLEIGSMYLFVYANPKYKDKLPYYDAFPIILPFGMDAEHFTAYNLHYLPPRVRWIILKKLMVNDELSTTRRLSKEVRLSMDYQMLKGASSFAELKPCIHQYLFSHVGQINGGMFIKIHPAEWNFSVLLPVQDFRSKNRSFSAETVWANSMRSR